MNVGSRLRGSRRRFLIVALAVAIGLVVADGIGRGGGAADRADGAGRGRRHARPRSTRRTAGRTGSWRTRTSNARRARVR